MRVAWTRLSRQLRAARPERYSPHRVGDVLVEPGEEAEAVLRGKIEAPLRAAACDRQAPCLAAERRVALEHGDPEAPFGKLLRGAESADSAAQDRHRGFRFGVARDDGCAVCAVPC
jgi:hypothetical protein